MDDLLRIATRDIPNPHHDGRARYGWKSVKAIPKGHVFTISPGAYDQFLPGNVQAMGTSTPISRETEATLMNGSAPHVPNTWDDIAKSLGTRGDGWLAGEVLQALLAKGAIPADELLALARQCYRDEV